MVILLFVTDSDTKLNACRVREDLLAAQDPEAQLDQLDLKEKLVVEAKTVNLEPRVSVDNLENVVKQELLVLQEHLENEDL